MAYKFLSTVTTFVEQKETKEVEVTLLQYIGLKVKTQREALGLKQIDLSRRTVKENSVPSVSAATVSYIELGAGNPSINTLEELSKALGIHISELFPPKEIVATSENQE